MEQNSEQFIKLMCNDGIVLMPEYLVQNNKVLMNMKDDGLDLDMTPINHNVEDMQNYISFSELRFRLNLKNDPLNDTITEQEKDFLQAFEKNELVPEKKLDKIGHIISIADFIDNQDIIDVCAKHIGSVFSEMDDIELMRKILKVTNDLTPEEEEKIRNANLWCKK